jgi:hypothetical protein
MLPRLKQGNLVMAYQDHSLGIMTAWLSYFGRHQRVWLAHREFYQFEGSMDRHGASILDVSHLPPDIYVLSRTEGFKEVNPGDAVLRWSGKRGSAGEPAPAAGLFQLWESTSGVWAVPIRFDNPNSLEGDSNNPFCWLGKGQTRIDVLAGCPGVVTLCARLEPGPCLPESRRRRLLLRSSGGWSREIISHGGPVQWTIPIPAGKSTITIESLDKPTLSPLPSGDTRPMLVGMSELSYHFEAVCPEQRSWLGPDSKRSPR